MILLFDQKLKILALILILINAITCIWGQAIEFEKIAGVPEYQLYHPSFDGEYYFLNSSISSNSYLTLDGVDYYDLGCNSSTIISAYSMNNGNIITVNKAKEICLSDNAETKIIWVDTNNVSHFHLLPDFENKVYFATSEKIYNVNDNGSIEILEELESFQRILASRVLDDSLYVLTELEQGFSLTNRDQNWNILDEIQIDYNVSNFIIHDEILVLADAQSKKLYYSFDKGVSFSEFDISNLFSDLFPIFAVVENRIVLLDGYSRDSILILEFDSSELSIESLPLDFILGARSINKNLILYSHLDIYVPLTLSPLAFDTISPVEITGTRFEDVEFEENTLHALSKRGYYRTMIDDQYWSTNRNIGGVLMELDGDGNIYIPSIEGYNYSSDGGETFSTKVVGTGGALLSFSDTLLFTGSGQCGKLLGGFPAKISTDGGETWTNADFDPAPCYVKDRQTITEERIWAYDVSNTISFGPGITESYWLGYFDRKEERFRMIEPLITENSFYKFYVDPKETIYAHPSSISSDSTSYRSYDLGETWTTLYNIPGGSIYPTADSTGTIVISWDGEKSKFFLQWDEDETYEEIEVTPNDIGWVYDVFYSSDGRMILSMQDGNFYIAEGLVNSTDELNSISPDISIYPNPTRQSFSITGVDVDTVTGLKIYDLQGRLLSSSIEPVEAFDVSHLSEGVYVLKMKLKDGREIGEKVVVLR